MLISLSLVAIALTVAAIWAHFAGSPFALGLGLLAGGFFAVTFILSENWNPRENRPFLRDYDPEERGVRSEPEKPRRGGGAPAPQYLPLPPECDIVRGHLCEAAPPVPKNYRNSCYIASSLGVLLSMRWVKERLAQIQADHASPFLQALLQYNASLVAGSRPNPELIRGTLAFGRGRRDAQQDAQEKIWGRVFSELCDATGPLLEYRVESEGIDDGKQQRAIKEVGREHEVRVSIRPGQENLQEMLLRELDSNDERPWQRKGKITRARYVFTAAPPILNLSIRRFNNNLGKDCSLVQVPERLSLPVDHFDPPLGAPPAYQLDGFVVHRGRSLHGGHYVGYIRTQGEWYLLDDLHPVPQVITREQALRAAQTAYLFYYSQIPPHPLA